MREVGARGRLERAISKAKVVEAATALFSSALDGLSYQDAIDDAETWPDLDGGPTLARLKIDDQYVRGPWVAISRGRVETIVGPFTMRSPSAFTLDRKGYLAFTVAACLNCGGVGTEVHAVRRGRLHRVLQSFANAD